MENYYVVDLYKFLLTMFELTALQFCFTLKLIKGTIMKDIRQQWKALAADRKITSEDIAALCIYRALFNEQGKEDSVDRLSKSFKPITNQVKLDNGIHPYGSLSIALNLVKRSTLFTWLDEADQKTMLDLAREIRPYGNEIK